MLYKLEQPAFVEIVEKAANVAIQNVVHLSLLNRDRQCIQRIMLAALRTKAIREAEKVFLVNLIEDGDHGLLDDLVLQCRDPQRTFPSIFFLYVHLSLIHISEPTRRTPISYAVFCLKKKKKK